MTASQCFHIGSPMDQDALIQTLRDATASCLSAAREIIPGAADLPDPVVRFDLRGLAAGQMRASGRGRLEIRFNLTLARRAPDIFLAQTVPHEVAHSVVWHLFGRAAKPHGPEWRAVMHQLGVSDPRRCHSFEVPEHTARRQRRWPYRCACREHWLSTTRHLRVQRGQQIYSCRECGSVLEPSAAE